MTITSLASTEKPADVFAALVDWLRTTVSAEEHFTLWYSAEASDFVRFNHAKVRQAGHVQQAEATLKLIQGERHASFKVTLSGNPAADRSTLQDALASLRKLVAALPADPYLLMDTSPWRSENIQSGNLASAGEIAEQVSTLAGAQDLVGFYAGGPVYRGFASSWGSLGWHEASSCTFDWSLFEPQGNAVKSMYAGTSWDREQVAAQMDSAQRQLAHFNKPIRQLSPGEYRAYLAPAALNEVVGLLNWGSFSARQLATKRSALQKLHSEHMLLSPLVSWTEQASGSLAPAFTPAGFQRQDQPLVEAGRMVGQLVSPRSAREYGLTQNGASNGESSQSLVMKAGDLADDAILKTLDTGLYIGNLWYLNYSDITVARLTGMTRFACFWVENGEIVAPVSTMRFDDSVFNFLGSSLEAVTQRRDLCVSDSTYGQRHTDSTLLPGVLTSRFTLTL
ncbi:metallopeptidase TldD-related protein [Pseudomonas luteola]|uniref:TldD/PmbA family protein n=1 Tax=Pseudomonas luteola TaxID=47886 RepID=A0ABS0MW23_PSELU|nr:metallopeptidase TldD-related protein [Pseudomonas luteola]MBH3439927.1 TldD/PmbA family protein [Pseudomonas luteola]